VLRALVIIGEAAKGVSDPLRQMHPGILWRRIIALRNIPAPE